MGEASRQSALRATRAGAEAPRQGTARAFDIRPRNCQLISRGCRGQSMTSFNPSILPMRVRPPGAPVAGIAGPWRGREAGAPPGAKTHFLPVAAR